MADFHDIQSTGPTTCMTKREFSACINALHDCGITDASVDPMLALTSAKCLIRDQEYDDIMKTLLRRKVGFLFVLKQFFQTFTFVKVMFMFKILGRHDVVTLMLGNSLEKNRQHFPRPVVIPNNARVHLLYNYWKACADNGSFKDLKKEVQEHIRKENEKLLDHDNTVETLQRALDFKMVFCVLLSQHSDCRLKRNNLLEELMTILPGGTEQRSINMVYFGQLAIAEAKDNNITKTEDYIRKAVAISESCTPCFATVSLFHDILYSYRNIYIFNNSRENLEKVIYWGHLAINRLKDEELSVQIMWKRVYLQYMFLSLLGFNSVFEVIDSEVPVCDLHMAKNAIEEMGRILEGIPVRREMIYYLANSRYYHLTNDTAKAKYYAEKAVELSNDGQYFQTEEVNIRKFCALVENESNKVSC